MGQIRFASEKEGKGGGCVMERVKGNTKYEQGLEGGRGRADPAAWNRWGSFCGQQCIVVLL